MFHCTSAWLLLTVAACAVLSQLQDPAPLEDDTLEEATPDEASPDECQLRVDTLTKAHDTKLGLLKQEVLELHLEKLNLLGECEDNLQNIHDTQVNLLKQEIASLRRDKQLIISECRASIRNMSLAHSSQASAWRLQLQNLHKHQEEQSSSMASKALQAIELVLNIREGQAPRPSSLVVDLLPFLPPNASLVIEDALQLEREHGEQVLFAAVNKSLLAIQFLVKRGADVNTKSSSKETVLFKATQFNHFKLVQYLVVQCGASVNETSTKKKLTPLHVASQNGNLEMITYLIEQCGAYFEARTKAGLTALSIAASRGHTSLVRYLLETHKKYYNVKENLVLKFFTYIANKKDTYGNTLLHYACKSGNVELVHFLVEELHADTSLVNNDNDKLLHWVGSLPVARYLVDSHALDVNSKNNASRTPLHDAVQRGNLEVVRFLVQSGARVDDTTSSLESALYLASGSCNMQLVTYLVQEAHADILIADINGITPLQRSARFGRLQVVKFLLQFESVDVNAKDKNGYTALHRAALFNHLGVVQVLVLRGADIHVTNNKGNTPLDLAVAHQSYDVVKFFTHNMHADIKNHVAGAVNATVLDTCRA